jgi:hypothetical protein
MGQRGNYIIKNQNTLTIHYTHWRANCIAKDLYLGENQFLQYVSECKITDEIINYPWLEGCVIIDKQAKHLYFWSWEIPNLTSVINYYLLELQGKWIGWHVEHLPNRMYDVEKLLGIDYISKQDFSEPDTNTKEEIIADKVEDWETTTVLVKRADDVFVIKTGNITIKSIISYGPEVIKLLKFKPRYELPKEDDSTQESIVFDIDSKTIFISQSELGLWEQTAHLWTGYKLVMGDIGYISTLKIAGIDTTNLILAQNKISEEFTALVSQTRDFNPTEFSQRFIQDQKDVVFHPDFFDNAKPRKTFIEIFRTKLKALFKKK